jgi:hypothetical protein
VTDENRFVRGITSPLNNGEFGYYYYRTLMAWNDNFEKGWPEIQHLYDARFYRLWRYYLQLCAAAFRARKYMQRPAGPILFVRRPIGISSKSTSDYVNHAP